MSKEFYDATSGNYDARHETATTKYMRGFETKILMKHAHGKILDIGCGTGPHSLLKNWTGLDPSEKMLEHVKGRAVVGKAEDMPFPGESFDTTICMFSVLNLCDLEKAVPEMSRVLKPGGTAIISVSSVWDKKKEPLYKRLSDSSAITKNVRIDGRRLVFKLFTKRQLMDVFKRNGFSLVEFDGIFITQKPYWGWVRNFTPWEKTKLRIDRLLPKQAGRLYFIVFKKLAVII